VGAETSLRLWVEDPPVEQVEVVADGVAVPTERYVIDGEPGAGLRVWVPAGATELMVRVAGATSSEPPWSLALGDGSSEPLPKRLRREIKLALGKGDADRAGRATEQAFGLALGDGRLSMAVDVGLTMAFELDRRRLDPEIAAGLLQLVEDAAQRYPKGRGDLAAYRGLHQWYQGATQDAAESLRDAARHAVRLEDEALAVDSIPMYAETLGQLGYFEDARGRAREGLRIVRKRDACQQGSALRTVGWVNLQLRQRGRPADDPAPFLDEALQLFGPDGECLEPSKLGGARLSLALLAVGEGRLDDAAGQLSRIDRRRITLDERVQVDDIEVRLSLARAGDATLRWAAYRRLQRSVDAVGTADARWRLHTRRGRLLERDADASGAADAYRTAEVELDAIVRLQAVGIGRGELADRYRESTAALVSLLVARGDVDDAWCIVRQDQARRRTAAVAPALALDAKQRAEIEETSRQYRREKREAEALEAVAHGLPRDEAEDAFYAATQSRARARELANALAKTLGQLAPHPRCSELSPPAAGELLLGLYPRERDWLVFASHEAVTTVHTVPTPSLDQGLEVLASALLEPVGPWLDATRRIRVLAHREAQRIDVHRLPWHGEPLGARMPVSYGVELPVRAQPHEPGRRALLVADPTDTLASAKDEIDVVDASLRAAGWTTTMISVSDTPEPGRVSLEGYDLFHYAGHAEASARPERGGWPPYPGGEAGWAAFLELGAGGQLTVHDVMTMSPAPRAAVLAGCRTGALELDTGQTSMALAFLVAGAEQVVASAEAVEDARGARFARGLYDALVREPGVDLVLAMYDAQRGLLEAGEEPAGYRVWVR
jgi:CHAT domain